MQIIDIHMGIRGAVDDALARAMAIGALVAIAVIHMLQLPDAFASIGYLGALFIAAVVAALLLAAVFTRTSADLVWAAAGGLAGLILLCYIISRSIGLPGFTDDTGVWDEAPGLVSMVVESFLVFVSTAVLVTRRQPMGRTAEAPETSGSPGMGMNPHPAGG
jgi:hypothetical protein